MLAHLPSPPLLPEASALIEANQAANKVELPGQEPSGHRAKMPARVQHGRHRVGSVRIGHHYAKCCRVFTHALRSAAGLEENAPVPDGLAALKRVMGRDEAQEIRSDMPVTARAEPEAERDTRAAFEAANGARSNVVATAPWVRTDRDVELRGVAVVTEKGIHTGYEPSRDGAEGVVTYSEMTFPSTKEALRHALDFYEGDEKGLEAAVRQRREIERELSDDGDTSRITRELPDDDPRPTQMSRAELKTHVEGWMERVGGQMRDLSPTAQAELRPEFNDLATRALDAIGDRRGAELAQEAPKSALYRSALSAETPVLDGAPSPVASAQTERLREGLSREADAAGLDGAAVAKRLETGASSALEEREWVKADIASVAASKGFDLGRETDRTAAAGIVDRFYERASEMLNEARGIKVETAASELRDTLGAMVRMNGREGRVRFESEAEAKGLVDDMKARYGENIVKDLAEGKTDALAKDFGDAGQRAKIAEAVTSAARDNEAFGLSPKEAEAAHDRLTKREVEERSDEREPSRDRER